MSERAGRPRLDPFLFYSDTSFRFALLVVCVLGASLLIFSLFFHTFRGPESLAHLQHCLTEASARTPRGPGGSPDPVVESLLQEGTQGRHLQVCLEPLERQQFVWSLGAMVLMLGVAGALYWTAPGRRIRQRRLKAFPEEDAPELARELAMLSQQVGLKRPPVFLVDPLNPHATGLAFGRRGRSYVELHAGLLASAYDDPDAFRATVLHELAHLRNTDVDKTWFTVALWQAFVGVALVPFLLRLLFLEDRSLMFFMGLRVLGLATLVYLMRNAVLRARELYADVRASAREGGPEAMERALTRLPEQRNARSRLGLHPSPEERRETVRETATLFTLKPWDVFGTGVVATIVFANLDFVLALLLPPQWEVHSSLGAALVFAPLVAGVVASGLWRSAFAARMRMEGSRGAGLLGLCLGAGLILGNLLSFNLEGGAGTWVASPGGGSFALLLLFGLLLGPSLFLGWIAQGASAWVEVATTRRSLRRLSLLGMAVAAVLLGPFLGTLQLWLSGSRFLSPETLRMLAWMIGSVMTLDSPWLLLTFFCAWAFPLAAAPWRERMAGAPLVEQAWLPPGSKALLQEPSHLPPLRPRVAFVSGLQGGLVACGLLLVLRLALRSAISDDATFALYRFTWSILLSAVVQAATALVVAWRVERLGALHGLCAAFCAAGVSAVGMLLINFAFGGSLPPRFVWAVFGNMANWGSLLALPLAVAASLRWRPRVFTFYTGASLS